MKRVNYSFALVSMETNSSKLNLLEALAQVEDFRAPRGRRYSLVLILLLVIMGTISGCLGYRALEDFSRRHHHALATQLQLPPTYAR